MTVYRLVPVDWLAGVTPGRPLDMTHVYAGTARIAEKFTDKQATELGLFDRDGFPVDDHIWFPSKWVCHVKGCTAEVLAGSCLDHGLTCEEEL